MIHLTLRDFCTLDLEDHFRISLQVYVNRCLSVLSLIRTKKDGYPYKSDAPKIERCVKDVYFSINTFTNNYDEIMQEECETLIRLSKEMPLLDFHKILVDIISQYDSSNLMFTH